jgi:hypothetical protein
MPLMISLVGLLGLLHYRHLAILCRQSCRCTPKLKCNQYEQHSDGQRHVGQEVDQGSGPMTSRFMGRRHDLSTFNRTV